MAVMLQEVAAVNRLTGQVVPIAVRDRPADLALERFDERAVRNWLLAKLEFWDWGDCHDSRYATWRSGSHRRLSAAGSGHLGPGRDRTL